MYVVCMCVCVIPCDIDTSVQEIVSIYPLLSPPRLTPGISNRCCNALALLQCVASHSDTRSLFLNCECMCMCVCVCV